MPCYSTKMNTTDLQNVERIEWLEERVILENEAKSGFRFDSVFSCVVDGDGDRRGDHPCCGGIDDLEWHNGIFLRRRRRQRGKSVSNCEWCSTGEAGAGNRHNRKILCAYGGYSAQRRENG